jgi:phospholipid/cholesterol/gamma-HCH transport system substrate-binding protein
MSGRKSPFRYTNEAVGALVLLSVIVFIAAVLQSGRLKDWFDPGVKLKVILPAEGLFGLSAGAEVKILGTAAGQVSQIVVDPDQQIHAVVDLKRKMKGFVRRDSQAIIRKEFGVAGASFLEITRGEGEPLDWEYAVVNAVAERAPTESMGELISDVRTKVMPVIDDAQRLIVNLNAITGKIARGEGAIGRLLVEDRMAREVETLLTQVNADIRRLAPILEALQTTVGNVSALTTRIAAQSGELPQMTRDAGQLLASLQSVMQDLSRTTPHLPKMIANVSDATADVPVLLGQTQQVLYELELLLQQLRSNWLLGGGGDNNKPPLSGRIPTLEVIP